MKKLLFVILLAFPTLVWAQDSFIRNGFERRDSYQPFFKERNGYVDITLYDTLIQKTKVYKIPKTSLYKYKYSPTPDIRGAMQPLVLGNVEDLAYVVSICRKAEFDCRQNYTLYKASGVASFFTSLVTPVAGLAYTIPTSLKPPRVENLGIPGVDMMQDDIYYQVYRRQALEKKSKINWICFGVGSAVHVGILFTVLSLFL